MLRVSDIGGELRISCAEQLARVGAALTRDLAHEQVWLILLSARNEIRGAIRLSEGGVHGTALRPVDVLRPVIVAGETAFALIHNHPSGDPMPSVADVDMTRKLIEAAEVVGLTLIDHVVVVRGGKFESLRDRMAEFQ